ncbi:hypothetical protein BN977_04136 [Mycolicibacterium cosmeticum]|uniref:Uncharacterized protein n=1 Tax=Mycolicibacterium cosmeticum TaxID=258533 RepID=W9BLA6_MYCCO|nr:hypothetical protein BN977_04136 [Mycolicibacterium cosmeticum]
MPVLVLIGRLGAVGIGPYSRDELLLKRHISVSVKALLARGGWRRRGVGRE